jgi:hypothetical protein
MIQVKLAKACRRRVKGAPMNVTERAAFHMMERGEAVIDQPFMAAFAKEKGLPLPKIAQPKKKGRSKKDEKK